MPDCVTDFHLSRGSKVTIKVSYCAVAILFVTTACFVTNEMVTNRLANVPF